MKFSKYILGFALVAAGLSMTSCDKDNKGAIYDGPAMANYTFETSEITSELEEATNIVPVVVWRTHSTEAYKTTVNFTTDAQDYALQTNEVSFGPGEDTDTLYVVATNMERGDKRICEIEFNEADKATANTFEDPIQKITVTVVWPRLLPAGTCTFMDYTCGMFGLPTPMVAENVRIVNVEGSDRYRILQPLYEVFNLIGDPCEPHNFEFHLLDDGSAVVDDATPMALNYWGYYVYYNTRSYSSYCYVGNDGNTYDVSFLLMNSAGSLYSGGNFVFVWDKDAEWPAD